MFCIRHCELIRYICADLPIENQLHKRLLNFLLSCASSNNIIVRMCYGSQSVSENKMTYLAGRYGKGKPTSLNIDNFAEWLQNCLQLQNRTSCEITASVIRDAECARYETLYQ